MPKTTRKISIGGLEKKISFEIDTSQGPINQEGDTGDTGRYYIIDKTTNNETHFRFGLNGKLLLVWGYDRSNQYTQYHDVVRFVEYNDPLPLPELRRSEHFGQLSEEKEKIARLKRKEAYETAASLLEHLEKPNVMAPKSEIEALRKIVSYGWDSRTFK